MFFIQESIASIGNNFFFRSSCWEVACREPSRKKLYNSQKTPITESLVKFRRCTVNLAKLSEISFSRSTARRLFLIRYRHPETFPRHYVFLERKLFVDVGDNNCFVVFQKFLSRVFRVLLGWVDKNKPTA